MNIYEKWEKALKSTEVIRPRINPLLTYATTEIPYIFLAESAVNMDTTVVRQGTVAVEKPSIILPPHTPLFSGFEMENMRETIDFLLIRGVHFPSLKYNNKVSNLDIYDNKLSKAVEYYKNKMQREENVQAGLVLGPEGCWQFSVLIFVCMMASKSAAQDIKRLLDDKRKH